MKIFMIISALLAALPGTALASMRCGTQLVLEGYGFDRVEQLCGQPDSTYPMGERYIYSSVRNPVQQATVAEVVRVDMWVYRHHENGFTRNLYFENGRLVRIELGDRK